MFHKLFNISFPIHTFIAKYYSINYIERNLLARKKISQKLSFKICVATIKYHMLVCSNLEGMRKYPALCSKQNIGIEPSHKTTMKKLILEKKWRISKNTQNISLINMSHIINGVKNVYIYYK